MKSATKPARQASRAKASPPPKAKPARASKSKTKAAEAPEEVQEPWNKFHPTVEQEKAIRAMAAYGIPHDQICTVFGITKPTLHKYFRDSLDAGMAEANAKVAESLFKMAIGGKHVAAAIYWTKARMGWRDVQAIQQLDENGHPISPGTTFVLKMER